MSDTITIKVNRVAGYAPGQEVEVQVDQGGIPLELSWRRRLRDAKRDQCCEIVVHHGTVQDDSPADESWEEEPES